MEWWKKSGSCLLYIVLVIVLLSSTVCLKTCNMHVEHKNIVWKVLKQYSMSVASNVGASRG